MKDVIKQIQDLYESMELKSKALEVNLQKASDSKKLGIELVEQAKEELKQVQKESAKIEEIKDLVEFKKSADAKVKEATGIRVKAEQDIKEYKAQTKKLFDKQAEVETLKEIYKKKLLKLNEDVVKLAEEKKNLRVTILDELKGL